MRHEKIDVYSRRASLFLTRLRNDCYGETVPLQAEIRVTGKMVPFARRLEGEYTSIQKGEAWGKMWDYAWFHLTGKVPASLKGKEISLRLALGNETTLFDKDGCPLTNFTTTCVFNPGYTKEYFPFITESTGSEEIDVWAEGSSSHWIDAGPGLVKQMELCEFRRNVWNLMLDVDVLLSLMECYDKTHPRRMRILKGLSTAIEEYRLDPARALDARKILKDLFHTPANPADLTACAVGHAHIDTGWLWPVHVTEGKVIRTFANQVNLIERYPDFIFGASQPQHYQFVKDRYPELFDRIKQAVKDGRWEVQGGMWVEADCNVIDGESMVRQFLYGKNFFMDEFGIDVKNLWLPDVFGYSAAMPQILKRAGVDFFLTQKLSWSQFNTFPHHTFMWKGIDGSEVLTHFPPENNYGSMLQPDGFTKAQNRFRENGILDRFMSLFGMGDGGGGPREEMIERGIRTADLEGAVKVRFTTAEEFFSYADTLKEQLPTWSGELYLELHRGTLTTQALVKKRNRRIEQLLRVVEMIYTCLPMPEWPATQLKSAWIDLLRNQFHDILPGSSVPDVYKDTHAEYEKIFSVCETLINEAGSSLFKQDENSLVLFNSLSSPFTAPVILPESWKGFSVTDSAGDSVRFQQEGDCAVALLSIPPLSFLTLKKGEAETAGASIPEKEPVLENDLIRYEFNPHGQLIRAFDKETEKEVIPEGEKGNLLSLYGDLPNAWEAWDVDCFYEDEFICNADAGDFEMLPSGSVRKGLVFSLKIGNSSLKQNVFLQEGSKRLDFETEADWHEERKMLRVSFPVSVTSDSASFDIQYGFVRRPTHENTSWDMARFETAAHKYADLSDADYGAAVLNDCKYGHRVYGSILDLNLLRSPRFPDEPRTEGFADQGQHSFTYSFLPHTGTLTESNVIAEAAMLNRKPVVFEGFESGDSAMVCTLESEGLSIEALKKAEKSDSLILRIVETDGKTSKGILSFTEKVSVAETDLVEWHDKKSVKDITELELTLAPFEIRTYKIKS